MNGITRYDFHLDSFGDCCCDMVVKDDGQFVHYDEYADKCEEIKTHIAVANMNNRASIEEITRLTDEVDWLREQLRAARECRANFEADSDAYQERIRKHNEHCRNYPNDEVAYPESFLIPCLPPPRRAASRLKPVQCKHGVMLSDPCCWCDYESENEASAAPAASEPKHYFTRDIPGRTDAAPEAGAGPNYGPQPPGYRAGGQLQGPEHCKCSAPEHSPYSADHCYYCGRAILQQSDALPEPVTAHNEVTEIPSGKCELCGEQMPRGEEMFRFHGYSGPCPSLTVE